MRLPSRILVGCLALMGLGLTAQPAKAGFITFTGNTVDENGTGFGNILSLLSVQAQANNTWESGSVIWNGTNDVTDGNATNTSKTQTAQTLQANNFDMTKFYLIFNINEPGGQPEVTLRNFELLFFTPDGTPMSFSPVKYDAPQPDGLPLTMVGSGQGSAGYVFEVTLTNAEALQFLSNSGNRVGLQTTQQIDQVFGGAENFYLAQGSTINPNVFATPAPAGIVLLASAIPMLGLRRLLRRKTAVA